MSAGVWAWRSIASCMWVSVCLQKYLVKQNELGFDEFCSRYGRLAYNKLDSDEPPPDLQVTSAD